MTLGMDSDIVFSAIRISTPLIYAALGGLLTYQAGILNIALDGFMIVAAFAAIAVAYATRVWRSAFSAASSARRRSPRCSPSSTFASRQTSSSPGSPSPSWPMG